MSQSNVTVVTAFYLMKSKFPPSKYKEWFDRFYRLNMNVVCFTDDNTYQYLNPPSNWHIIKQPIEQWKIYQHVEYFRDCELNDWEQNHSKELYMIWNNKPYFIKQVVEENPYQSDYFVWADIGCVRNDHTLNCAIGFPNNIPNMITQDQVMFSRISNSVLELNSNGTICKAHDIPLYQYKYKHESFNCIQGGFFACGKNSITDFVREFEIVLKDFIEQKYFGGKDQHLFNTMVAKRLPFLKVLNADWHPVGDLWFSFLFSCAKK